MSCEELKPILAEQARILSDIRADLRETDARQIRLIEGLTTLTKDVVTTSRPSHTIQIGGFVLAVTLLLLNLLGLRISAGRHGISIETETGGRTSSSTSDSGGRMESEALSVHERETDNRSGS